jgi:uncharacterized protein (DUF488 family)
MRDLCRAGAVEARPVDGVLRRGRTPDERQQEDGSETAHARLLHCPRVTVYTLGHSTLALDDFLARLHAHGIQGVADVRRFPASRRHPHFAREALARSLAERALRYDWLESLGGRRPARRDSPHRAWRLESFRGYADHMESDEFARGLATLLDLAHARPTAVMCAEAVPWRCHRQLIADALVARGSTVVHVMSDTAADTHRLTSFARVDGERVVYDVGMPGSLPGT